MQHARDEDGPPTPIEGSGAYPILRQAAQETADDLLRVGTRDAMLLRQQLIAIVALMAAWSPEHRPDEDERRRLVDELVEASKRAAPMLAR